LCKQFSDMQTDVRFELEHALQGEDVRDDLAFPCVIGPITGIENSSMDDHECVVEIAFQASAPRAIDDLECVWVRDRNMVWSESDEGSCKTEEARSGPGMDSSKRR